MSTLTRCGHGAMVRYDTSEEYTRAVAVLVAYIRDRAANLPKIQGEDSDAAHALSNLSGMALSELSQIARSGRLGI